MLIGGGNKDFQGALETTGSSHDYAAYHYIIIMIYTEGSCCFVTLLGGITGAFNPPTTHSPLKTS